jgi:hypothetical protein
MTMRSIAVLFSVLPVALSGCAGGYIMSQYGTAASKVVKTSCGGEYRVSEKGGKLLVSAFAVSEAYHSACESPPPGRTGIPYEFAAVQFFQESKRPLCVITAGERLELLHSEFAFTCPPAPPAAASKKK